MMLKMRGSEGLKVRIKGILPHCTYTYVVSVFASIFLRMGKALKGGKDGKLDATGRVNEAKCPGEGKVHTCRQKDRQTYRQTYRHTDIQTYIHTYIHTYIQTDRQTDRQTYIHTYIHTDIQTYRHTYIHTYIHTYLLIIEHIDTLPKYGKKNFRCT